jgi:hypothetical protein
MLTGILLGVGYSSEAVSALPNVGLHGSVVSGLVIATWAFDMILNVSVTVAIAGRLWWMDRTMASLTATLTNRYTSSIYLVVESGAISAVAGTIVIALFAWSNPASLTGFDVVCQLLVWVHLSFLLLRALNYFILAGFDTSVGCRSGWANRSISRSKLWFLENSTG